MIKAIIPSAGYGTRMSMKPNESKEMLIDSTGKPVIQYSLDLCSKYGLEPIIITRKEKTDLINYVQGNATLHIIEPFGEWPDTVLSSSKLWGKRNILILPDTRFSPDSVLQDISDQLALGCKSVTAYHNVTDPTKWCVIDNYKLTEKPLASNSSAALGLIGFEAIEGHHIFNGLKRRSEPVDLIDAGFVRLDSFIDITRTGKII